MPQDPRSDAFRRLDANYEVRVLEPSPPTVTEGPWFADDPAARGEVAPQRTLVSPVSGGDTTWHDLAQGDHELAGWAKDRWLGPWRRLEDLPGAFARTREILHGLAEGTLKPAREAANGKIGLRFTRGGFGTPFFGDDEQVRVEGADLVRVARGEETGREPVDGADPSAAGALGDWYGFVTCVLEELRAHAGAGDDDSRVQIWPEHFDASTDLGREADGTRVTFGGSPGDDAHPEPYLYVLPWKEQPAGELWNAATFSGAELSYAELLGAHDQRAAGLDFFRNRRKAIAS